MELIEISHPLKDHYLTNLRDKNTDFDTFRDSASKLSYFLVVELQNISLPFQKK